MSLLVSRGNNTHMDCAEGELLKISKGLHASEEFDTDGLMEWHARGYKWVVYVESHFPNIMRTSSINEYFGSSVRLRGLQPIRAKSLEIGKHHQGRVLFGTLCADAHRIVSITTVLQDECGDGVRLAIYNAPLSIWRAVDVRRLYPKGAKVAVKEPHFKRADDGLLMVCVDNPHNIEILSLSERDAESSLVADLLELRAEGNKCFREGDWERAIECYSICIDLALFRQKIGAQLTSSLNIQKEVRDALVCSYSNRAEARLMSKEHGQAVKDCEEALKLDPQHVKTLFRKGRAFRALGEYELACHCFKTALQQCPTAKEIKLQYEKSKKLNEQNQQGKFDLSAYFLSGGRPEYVHEISNYIGPVLIKETVRGGRGLFAAENVEIGDVLLVDNAIACSCKEIISMSLLGQLHDMMEGVVDLVAKIISSSMLSPRTLQQIQYLPLSSSSDVMVVPPMDLFRINNAKWESYVWRRREGLELGEDKLLKIIENLTCVTEAVAGRKVKRYGLWALPSFINHSCFPNSNSIVVGEAMLVIATRRIAAGDEITISYFDSLVPLVEREMVCSRKGIRCDCKRCILERRLAQSQASPFEKIARSIQCSVNESSFPSLSVMPWMLSKYVMELEDAMDASALTAEEKQLLRASFHSAYYNLIVLPPGRPLRLPSLMELVEAGQNACPGNAFSFALSAVSVAEYQGKNSAVLKKAKEVCLTLCGNQGERVLHAILKSAARETFTPSFVDFRFRGIL